MENKQKLKPRGGSGNNGHSPVIGDNGLMTKPGDNSRYATLVNSLSSWPRVDKTDVNALERRLSDYLIFCEHNDMKVGNMMCYLALGITREDARDWLAGTRGTPEHMIFIKKVKAICGATRELLMQDWKLNPVTGIFWQKNHDGFKDIQDVVLTPNNPLGEGASESQLADLGKKYLLDE